MEALTSPYLAKLPKFLQSLSSCVFLTLFPLPLTLRRKHQKTFDQLKEILSPANNFLALRLAQDGTALPALPNFKLYLDDLSALGETKRSLPLPSPLSSRPSACSAASPMA